MMPDTGETIPAINPPAPREEETIPDHTLLRVIGRGSYGEVWEARNVMGTPRAVKIIRRVDFDSPRPFEREFEGIQRYEPVSRTHPGLVPVLHVGKDADGACFYYVMELADDAADTSGTYVPKTLRGELLRHRTLPVDACIEVGISLASALGHLHRAGLVHRDVKPSNIIIAGGMAKLADVGLVAKLSDSRSMVGTEGYFAPEGTGQPRSDVFSLGKVLYECVTGKDRLSFPDVPAEWGGGSDFRAAFEFMEIVLRAAEPDPARRYKDTDEVLADLALLKAGKSLRYLRRVETRLKRTLQVLAFSALGIAVAGGAWYYEKRNADQLAAANAKATNAEADAKRLLRESLVAEAAAVRQSGRAGSRAGALQAVARALRAGAPVKALRSEAASALALLDVGPVLPAGGAHQTGHCVMWSPDADFYAIAARAGGRVEVRRRDHRVVSVFESGSDSVGVALGPGAEHAAIVHSDGHLSLWRTDVPEKVWETEPTEYAGCPSFSADGKWIVYTAGPNLMARACAPGEAVRLATCAVPLRDAYLAPDGKWIAALQEPDGYQNGGPTKNLGFKVWTGLSGAIPGAGAAAELQEHDIASNVELSGVSISGDSRYLAAAVGEDRLRVWEIPAMAQLVWLRGHQRSVRATAFHPQDSNILISTAWDATTRFWNISTRQEIMKLALGGEGIQLFPDRGEILVRDWGIGGFHSAGVTMRTAIRSLNIPSRARTGLFADVAWNRDGSLLAASGDSGVIVWDTASGQALALEPPDDFDLWRTCDFDPDNDRVFYSGARGVYACDITRTAGGELQKSERSVISGFRSNDLGWAGQALAILGADPATGKTGVLLRRSGESGKFLDAGRNIDRMAASPDGRRLIVGLYPDSGGLLWDLTQPVPTRHPVKSASQAKFAFSADGAVLITGTEKEITFTRADSPDEAAAPPVPRHDCQVVPSRIAVSKAANLVAMTTSPGEVTLCDGTSFEPVLTLDSALTPFDCSLAFSPDGGQLALAGGTSRLMIWDLAWLRQELTRMGLGW